jgi:hypothetical protein
LVIPRHPVSHGSRTSSSTLAEPLDSLMADGLVADVQVTLFPVITGRTG